MKKTKEEIVKRKLRKRYYDLFSRIEKVYDKYNLSKYCDIKNGSCIENRTGNMGDNSCCCCGCKHLTKNGCSIKAISCKLWFCGNIPMEARIELNILRKEAEENGLYRYRDDIEGIFENDSSIFTHPNKYYIKYIMEEL